jgi:hypothetical protein
MARNIGLFGRRELAAHRATVDAMTVSAPAYKEVDDEGHREWVVDVYFGPAEEGQQRVLKDIPIASYARELITGANVPVLLDRSRQGRYTVIGRSKIQPSGSQTSEGSLLDPTYHYVECNLAELKSLHVADLDWAIQEFVTDPPHAFVPDDETPFVVLRATNAFGRQVYGPEVENPDTLTDPVPLKTTKTRHIKIGIKAFGPPGDPSAIEWGVDPFVVPVYETVEIIS